MRPRIAENQAKKINENEAHGSQREKRNKSTSKKRGLIKKNVLYHETN